MYTQCIYMKRAHFGPLLAHIAVKVGRVDKKAGPVKRFFRVLEKCVLRPTAGVPWDIIRALIICDSMDQIVEVISAITSYKGVRIVTINNRFSNPKSGWADVSAYLTFDNPLCRSAVAEIQIAHRKLMIVREQMGAHDVYDDGRFAGELLRCKGHGESAALPWCLAGTSPAELFSIETGFYILPSSFPWCLVLLMWFEGNALLADAVQYRSPAAGEAIEEIRVPVFKVVFLRKGTEFEASLLFTDGTEIACEIGALPLILPGALDFKGLRDYDKVVPSWLSKRAGVAIKSGEPEPDSCSIDSWTAAWKTPELGVSVVQLVQDIWNSTGALSLMLIRSAVDYMLRDPSAPQLDPGLYVGDFGDRYGHFRLETLRLEYQSCKISELSCIFEYPFTEPNLDPHDIIPHELKDAAAQLDQDQQVTFLVLSKVTGDHYVPAGQVTFVAPMGVLRERLVERRGDNPTTVVPPGFSSPQTVQEAWPGFVTLARHLFRDPHWAEAHMVQLLGQGSNTCFAFGRLDKLKVLYYLPSQRGSVFGGKRD